MEDPKSYLSSALLEAHFQIMRYAEKTGMRDAPRTTLVAAVVQEGHAHWIHCGDSRLYLVRAGQIVKRTADHSYMEMVKKARTPPPEGMDHVNRNALFTCLGSPSTPIYDLTKEPVLLRQGDRMLLCSDGLWGVLDDDLIARSLGRQDIEHAVTDLVEDALNNAGSGSDNVSAVIMEWETPDEEDFADAERDDTTPFEDTIPFDPLEELMEEPEEPDVFNDEIVERSVAEINDSIRRSKDKK